MSGGVAVMALAVMNRQNQSSRHVQTWQKNPDGSCTFFYDDGSEETAVCTDPPI